MNEFVPRGYLTLKKALEHFGKLKHGDKWEAEKASSQQEFQQLLFEGTVPAEHFIGGKLTSLESSIWGREAEYIFASGWATIHGGNEYFPAELRGRVLIKQSSIDALSDGDSDDPSQSPKAISDGALTAEASPSTAIGAETRREKRARETQEKYRRWYDLAQEIKGEGKWTRPTDIAGAIAKREKGSTERGVNAKNIRRRLDKHYPRWAERGQTQKTIAIFKLV